MNFIFKLLLSLRLAVLVGSQGVKVENIKLTANSPVHCDTIIDVSTFEGDCCAVNVTDGDGCVLNVVNGRCIVKGQYWSLDFTSTLKAGGIQCPPSEYVLGTTDFPTQAPLSAAPSSLRVIVGVSAVFTALVALVL